MNGRVYDPVLGRFLSADPFVPYPLSTQGFDRYTYTDNNPLSFTDPSGFFFGSNAERGYDPRGGWAESTEAGGSAGDYGGGLGHGNQDDRAVAGGSSRPHHGYDARGGWAESTESRGGSIGGARGQLGAGAANPRERQIAQAAIPLTSYGTVVRGSMGGGVFPGTYGNPTWGTIEDAVREARGLGRDFGDRVMQGGDIMMQSGDIVMQGLRDLFRDLVVNEAKNLEEGAHPIGNNEKPTRGGGVNTDLPGGEKAAEETFNDLAKGEVKHDPDTGGLKAENDVRLRRRSDGRMRVEVPAGAGTWPGHETIHFND